MTRTLSLLSLVAGLALAACVMAPSSATRSGTEDYADFCAGCHGMSGKGDGEMATSLSQKPADLTLLARGNGGAFPTTQVMAKIWGYTGGKGQGVMPNFGPLLEGDLVLYDGGDGIQTPTPIRLVQIAEHVKSLQAPPSR